MRPPLHLESDPIMGLATPPGSSAVAVLRLSGPNLLPSLLPLFSTPSGNALEVGDFTPRKLRLLYFLDYDDAPPLDQVLVVYFPAPHSATGEDQVEIHPHGSPVILSRMMERLLEVGFRTARPGEFSRRAYLNGKMDLVQAEALMGLIEASSLRAAREASRQLAGSLSERLGAIRGELVALLSHLEAGLDFPDEEISPDNQAVIAERLAQVLASLQEMLSSAQTGRHLSEGFQLVIMGRPNVGKSSLFNRLIGQDRAIVTPLPGTTRDLIENQLIIDGIPVLLVDSAGIRSQAEEIEQEGIRRAKAKAQGADGVLFVGEAHLGLQEEEELMLGGLDPERLIVVWNKGDLCSPLPDPTRVNPPSPPQTP
ncbi:MAG: tRNA uridine-5-carboxymethylaminomethyl(34) synthesis GTPase MnmE, partial [Magnetococcales bacterium]|nr:tRNA uridine-5-carboxymethylaminomethyl(34) synthesis GTPase MnmE [Magnetococcales bacterium]